MIDMKPVVLVIGMAALVFTVTFDSAEATEVLPCKDDPRAINRETPIPDDMISISGCTKPPCRFRRKSKVVGEIRFVATRDIKQIKNEVHGVILGVPFPFIGVDGTSACQQIYQGDGTTKAPCPLKAGTEYVYRNTVNILDVYPKIKVLAHWALVADDGSKPVCFMFPARITS